MTRTEQLTAIATVLATATDLSPEQQAVLDKVVNELEALRAEQALNAGASTANVVGFSIKYTVDKFGHAGARGAGFMTGFFNALRSR